jgi:tetratricopeptide (TPR) repeat protein
MQQADQLGESTQPKKRIFISYGRLDATHVAAWLHQELVALGYDVWLDQHDLQQATGAEWERKIEDAISQSNVVIALMSPHSVRPQSECRNEISLAKDSDLAIVPVMVNRCDRPLRLHALQYIDLAGFERLSQQARAILLKKVIDAIEHGVPEDPLLASLREKFAPLDFDWMFSRHEKFVGREWLFDQFDKWLQDNSEPVLFLVGPPGIGKSAALSKWIQMRMKIGAVHFCRHDRADLRDPVVMVKSIVTQLLQVQNQLPGFAESIRSINLGSSGKGKDSTDRAAELMDTMVLDPLRKIQPGQCWVLVIDALDEGGEGIQNLLANVQGHLPPTVKMIVSARPEADVLTLFPNKVVLNALGVENQADLVKYVQQCVDLSKRFAASDETEKQRIVDGVVAWSEGVFLVAVLVLGEIAAGRLEINKLSDPIGGLAGFYLQHFRRLFTNAETYQDVADCLEVMLVSHKPLSDQFIAEVLDRPVRKVTQALNQLGSLVPVQQGTRSPFHKSLFDWLRTSQETPHTYALSVGGGLDRIKKWRDRVGTAEANHYVGQMYEFYYDFNKAETFYELGLQIALKTFGKDHPSVATSLNNLAGLLPQKGEYAKAIPLYERALVIEEKTLGKDHPDIAISLHKLGALYKAQCEDEKALPMIERALAISEKTLGKDHPDLATSLNNLAELYCNKKDYGNALPLYGRALAIREKTLGKDHPDVAKSLDGLALLYSAQGDYANALPLKERALAIYEKAAGKDHPDVSGLDRYFVARSLEGLALLYSAQGDYAKALPLKERALAIDEKAYGKDHPNVARSLEGLAALFKAQGDYAKALPLYEQSLAIWEIVFGKYHHYVAEKLNNLAELYAAQSDYAKAKPMFMRTLAIVEKVYGKDHQNVAHTFNNLGVLYCAQSDYEKALSLFEQAIVIDEKALGTDHPSVGISLNNYADCLEALGKTKEAAAARARAKKIQDRIDCKSGKQKPPA